MQCVNCGFQNMPGSETCGRCSTSLTIATAVMDVHPPRAGKMKKRLRQAIPVQKAFFRTRDALHGNEIVATARHAVDAMPPLPIFLRLIFPGWSHFYLKQKIRGHLFLWSFVMFLLPAILMFGTWWGSFWLGMAFSVHSSAALDIVMQTFADAGTRDRIGRSVMVSLMLGVFVYLPILWLIHGVAQPHMVVTPIAPFQQGDVILVNQWAHLKRGDVVMYALNYQRWPANAFGHERLIQNYTGDNVDRVLALPGDKVECRNGALLVNGVPSPALPLNGGKVPEKMKWVVPPDHYLIVPSGAPGMGSLNDPALWADAGSIDHDDIAGRAYLQTLPWSRLHFIH